MKKERKKVVRIPSEQVHFKKDGYLQEAEELFSDYTLTEVVDKIKELQVADYYDYKSKIFVQFLNERREILEEEALELFQ